MSQATLFFSKVYARRVEKRRRSIVANQCKNSRQAVSHRSLWTWIWELLHATETSHYFHVTCNTSMPESTFWAEMGQARREASALFSGIQVPQGRHNEKLPEWELHPVGGTLIRVAAGRESGSAMLYVLNVSIDTKAVDIYAPPAK